MPHVQLSKCFLVSVCVLIINGVAGAVAARLDEQARMADVADARQVHSNPLMTYYFDVSEPEIALSTGGSGRAGRTGLTVKLTDRSVSRFTPVVMPKASGVVHSVSSTWVTLKNLATMFERINAINSGTPSSPRLFPRGALAVTAAQDSTGPNMDIRTLIDAAEARGQRSMWAETSPGSVMLLPAGQSTAAVADIWDVTFDAKSGAISLELDVVHDPHTISEFEPHGKQSLEAEDAHYHFATAPGVKVDAAVFLKSLQDSNYKVEDMHVFAKLIQTDTCFEVSLTSSTTEADMGQDVNITVTLDDARCNTRNAAPSESLDSKVTPQAAAGVALAGPVRKVELMIIGPADWTNASGDRAPLFGKTPAPGERNPPYGSLIFPDFVGYGNTAWASFTVLDVGLIVVQANAITDTSGGELNGVIARMQGAYILVNTRSECNCTDCNTSGSAATLKLRPAKAYRHFHESITLTAVARDTSGTPVQGATVVFAVHGDCLAHTTQPPSVVTNAAGEAPFKLVADESGAVTVVAAALGANGAIIMSEASVIFFFTHHRHREERDRRYYGIDTDVYAATAAKLEQEQLAPKVTAKYN